MQIQWYASCSQSVSNVREDKLQSVIRRWQISLRNECCQVKHLSAMFLVKQGRSQVKRYGCIFTCLNIRAVHIEVAHTLDSDSFLNALCRFIAKRGKPVLVRTDNSSNFVSGDKEICLTFYSGTHSGFMSTCYSKMFTGCSIPPLTPRRYLGAVYPHHAEDLEYPTERASS